MKYRIYAVPGEGRTKFTRAGIQFPVYPAYLEMDEKDIPQAVWDEPMLIKEKVEDSKRRSSE